NSVSEQQPKNAESEQPEIKSDRLMAYYELDEISRKKFLSTLSYNDILDECLGIPQCLNTLVDKLTDYLSTLEQAQLFRLAHYLGECHPLIAHLVLHSCQNKSINKIKTVRSLLTGSLKRALYRAYLFDELQIPSHVSTIVRTLPDQFIFNQNEMKNSNDSASPIDFTDKSEQNNTDHFKNNTDNFKNNTDHFKNNTDHYKNNTDHYKNNTDHFKNNTDHLNFENRVLLSKVSSKEKSSINSPSMARLTSPEMEDELNYLASANNFNEPVPNGNVIFSSIVKLLKKSIKSLSLPLIISNTFLNIQTGNDSFYRKNESFFRNLRGWNKYMSVQCFGLIHNAVNYEKLLNADDTNLKMIDVFQDLLPNTVRNKQPTTDHVNSTESAALHALGLGEVDSYSMYSNYCSNDCNTPSIHNTDNLSTDFTYNFVETENFFGSSLAVADTFFSSDCELLCLKYFEHLKKEELHYEAYAYAIGKISASSFNLKIINKLIDICKMTEHTRIGQACALSVSLCFLNNETMPLHMLRHRDEHLRLYDSSIYEDIIYNNSSTSNSALRSTMAEAYTICTSHFNSSYYNKTNNIKTDIKTDKTSTDIKTDIKTDKTSTDIKTDKTGNNINTDIKTDKTGNNINTKNINTGNVLKQSVYLVTFILSLTQSNNQFLRVAGTRALGNFFIKTGNTYIIDKLYSLAKDISMDVRMAAVFSLGMVSHDKNIVKILSFLSLSHDPFLRKSVCLTIGLFLAGTGHSDGTDLLETLLYDCNTLVQQSACIGLGLLLQQCNSSISNYRRIVNRIDLLIIKSNDTCSRLGALLFRGLIYMSNHKQIISYKTVFDTIDYKRITYYNLFYDYNTFYILFVYLGMCSQSTTLLQLDVFNYTSKRCTDESLDCDSRRCTDESL
ncbi:26S proteasome regulatory complex, subunit RPN2/PSMD1, partial [Pseudoloma neurophilia]